MGQSWRLTVRDVAAWLLLTAAILAITNEHDRLEEWATWTVAGRHWDLHQLVIAVLIMVLVVLASSWQRHHQALRQADDLVAMERDLAVANTQFRSLFDYHPSSVFSLDRDGRYTSANAAAGQLGGYPIEELADMSFTEIVHPDDLPQTLEAFLRVLDGDPQQIEVRVVHRDGHVVELDLVGLPIITDRATGEVSGVYGIAQDITERKRLHAEVARALEEAQAANDAKSRFLANVSHEVRTPLASMLAAAELLTETDLTDQQQRMIGTIERSGERLLRLVNEVLDLAQIEAGRVDVRREPYSVRGVVADLVPLAQAAAERKGLDLFCHIAPSVPEQVVGDPHRLAQVLTNLLDNAVKFTDEGCVRLSVWAGAAAGGAGSGPGSLVVDVEDTGIGISACDRDRIFDAFSQADETIVRRFGGTGLGLAICRELVTAMGGTITVASTLGQGTRFTVTLPAAPAG